MISLFSYLIYTTIPFNPQFTTIPIHKSLLWSPSLLLLGRWTGGGPNFIHHNRALLILLFNIIVYSILKFYSILFYPYPDPKS